MSRLFGMVARRRASIAVGTLLAVAVVGTTVASAPGTFLRMGVTNTITGNYMTTLQGTVSSWLFQARNNSATSTSAAILAYAPFGGVPIDLRAKLGQPPMRVNSNVKVPNLNADRVDYYHASIPLAPNTIAVRDGSNTINANLNGNANTANSAGNANNANALNGYAANSLTRVAYMGSSATVALTTTEATYGGTLTITAPVAGFVRVNGNFTALGQACTTSCWIIARTRHIESNTYSITTEEGALDGATSYGNVSMDRVFPVAAGTNTFDIRAYRITAGDGTLYGWFGELTAEFSPFGSGGAGTLGVNAPKNVPMKELP